MPSSNTSNATLPMGYGTAQDRRSVRHQLAQLAHFDAALNEITAADRAYADYRARRRIEIMVEATPKRS